MRNQESLRRRVELSFYRSQIYSKGHKMHKQSHYEINYVIENREVLGPVITQSSYFQFRMREFKNQEFQESRGSPAYQLGGHPSDAASMGSTEHYVLEEQKSSSSLGGLENLIN